LRRNGLLKHVIEGKTGGTKVKERRGRRRKQQLDELQETKGYWKFKGYGTLARETVELTLTFFFLFPTPCVIVNI
jgi:hypothetical protein